MKNREKYMDEILENSKKSGEETRASVCEFIYRIVLPTFGDGVSCFTINCAWCKFLLGIWLDEEYTEPPKPEVDWDVDWDNVPVDTLVRVRDYECCDWNLRYFKGIDKSNQEEKYEAWSNGATSKTANDSSNHWNYCELVEDEDEE